MRCFPYQQIRLPRTRLQTFGRRGDREVIGGRLRAWGDGSASGRLVCRNEPGTIARKEESKKTCVLRRCSPSDRFPKLKALISAMTPGQKLAIVFSSGCVFAAVSLCCGTGLFLYAERREKQRAAAIAAEKEKEEARAIKAFQDIMAKKFLQELAFRRNHRSRRGLLLIASALWMESRSRLLAAKSERFMISNQMSHFKSKFA